jgi:decaprenyl-phosphate phosphoribosyltransferase
LAFNFIMISAVIRLMRIKHWVKNLFIFVPVFFAGEILNWPLYFPLLLGFLAFGLAASSIYIVNDYRDIDKDRLHPKKKLRPLAAGTIKPNEALILAVLLFGSAFVLAWFVDKKFFLVLSIYFIMNMGYSFGLKNVAILDVIIVSIGFVLRIKCGSVISDIALSQWIIIMVFLLALFIALAKRRDDLLIKEVSGQDMRAVSKIYSKDFLGTMLSMFSGIIVVAYMMYTLSPEVIQRMGTYRLFYTSLFVVAGIMRYLQLALVDNNSGSPVELLLSDRFLLICLGLWVLSFYLLIYFKDLVLFQ